MFSGDYALQNFTDDSADNAQVAGFDAEVAPPDIACGPDNNDGGCVRSPPVSVSRSQFNVELPYTAVPDDAIVRDTSSVDGDARPHRQASCEGSKRGVIESHTDLAQSSSASQVCMHRSLTFRDIFRSSETFALPIQTPPLPSHTHTPSHISGCATRTRDFECDLGRHPMVFSSYKLKML